MSQSNHPLPSVNIPVKEHLVWNLDSQSFVPVRWWMRWSWTHVTKYVEWEVLFPHNFRQR